MIQKRVKFSNMFVKKHVHMEQQKNRGIHMYILTQYMHKHICEIQMRILVFFETSVVMRRAGR